MKNKIFSAIIISLLFFIGCNDRIELEQDTVVGVYVNIMIAEETYTDNLDSLNFNTEEVFKSFGVTKEDYEFTLESNKEDKEYWDLFFKKSLKYLDSLKTVTSD